MRTPEEIGKAAAAKQITGSPGGAPIPPDAPQDPISQVLAEGGGMVVFDPATKQPTGEIITPVARAAVNERKLAPLKPAGKPLDPATAAKQLKAMGLEVPANLQAEPAAAPVAVATAPPQPAAQPAPAAQSRHQARRLPRPSITTRVESAPASESRVQAMPSAELHVDEPTEGMDLPESQTAGELPQQGEPGYSPDYGTIAPLTEEDRRRMPAASDTDSPSRGIPQPRGRRADLEVTGGFGDVIDQQYFPLDGSELRELVLGIFDQLAAQLQNDLRFSMALVYPRVRAKVIIEVEGETDEAKFDITKLIVPAEGAAGSTPQEVARTLGRTICFVVEGVKQEFTPEGESDQPPDAMRDELGLTKPGKRMIMQNGRPVFIDMIVGSTGDVSAVTGGGR